jgi:hypothetical protein
MRQSGLGKRALAALFAVAALSGCAADTRQCPLSGCVADTRQRVVLITIDTLRHDAFMGEPGASLMPITRAFAERGQTFASFYSASSSTQPTHASMFTGLHPWQHGVSKNGIVLADELRTVAEEMGASGFRTGAVVASFPLERRFGFAQGFDSYDDALSLDIGLANWSSEQIYDRRFYSLAEEVTDRAIALFDSLGGERQFIWIHYFDPHDPYGDTVGEGLSLLEIRRVAKVHTRHARWMVGEARRGYERDVSSLDAAIAPLLERIAADSSAIETHVVFTADHGESLGEAGVIGHGDHATPEQVHVPTFIVSPRLEPGLRSDVAGSVDLAPTLLSLAGLNSDLAGGRDLSRPPPADPVHAIGMRRPLTEPLSYAGTDGRVSRLPEFEFFSVRGGDFYRGNAENVERNGHEDDAADVRALFAQLSQLLAARPGQLLLDSETREALEALGYID